MLCNRKGPPKPLMRRAPGTQFGVGISARIDVGEGGGFGIGRDGQFQGKVTGLIPVGSMIETAGQPPAVDAKQIEESDLFLFGGKPGKLRVFQNVVEREQPPAHGGIIPLPAVPDVLNSQLVVNLFAGYSARLCSTALVGQSILYGKPAIHQVAHKTKRPLSIRDGIEEVTELSPREHAAMETDQGDPLRLAALPAERL